MYVSASSLRGSRNSYISTALNTSHCFYFLISKFHSQYKELRLHRNFFDSRVGVDVSALSSMTFVAAES